MYSLKAIIISERIKLFEILKREKRIKSFNIFFQLKHNEETLTRKTDSL